MTLILKQNKKHKKHFYETDGVISFSAIGAQEVEPICSKIFEE